MSAQRIDVPGYGLIDFPATMSDEAIVKAIRNLPLKQPKAVLSEDPGAAQSLLIGAGRTTDRVVKGMQQLYYGATNNDAKLAELKDQAAEDDRLYAPLQEARPWSTGIGEAAPSMLLPTGGAATLWANAAKFGAAGAIPGVLEYGSAGDRFRRGVVGAASGAATPVLGAGVKAAWSVAEPLWEGGRKAIAGRVLNRVSGDSAPAVIRKLKSAAPLIPGSQPTAAQVAESGGIAALERAAAAADPEAYTMRAMEQASARMNALRSVAGDDAAMTAAQAARKAATEGAYNTAKGATYAVDDELAALLRRPIMKRAMARAQDSAENQGRAFSLAAKVGDDPLLAAGGVSRRALGSQAQITGQGLQDLKMSLDAMLKDPTSGIAGAEAGTVKAVRSKIVNWMEDRNPEFKAARTQYADLSRPIDQMKVGQYLMDKAAPALSDFGALGQETGATYAKALRNSTQTARGATGFNGNVSLESLMTPDQMSLLSGIGSDLARKSNAQNLGRGVGSDTFQKLSMQNIAEQSGMPRMVGGLLSLPGVSRATAWAYRDTDQKMQAMLADALLDPAKAASLMERANQKWMQDNPQTRRLLEQAVARSGGLLTSAGVSQ